jgi:hypothetical protein
VAVLCGGDGCAACRQLLPGPDDLLSGADITAALREWAA